MKRPAAHLAISAVTKWNREHVIGTRVRVFHTTHRGERAGNLKCETTTRTDAFISDSGDAVIFLDGVSGYWSLEAIEVIR